jgi:MFS family permease
MAPFFPSMAEEEKGVTSSWAGLIMASLSVSFVIASFVVGMKISKIGRRLVMYLGILMTVVSMVGFGFMIWVPNKILFITLAFALRLLSGTASAFI